MIRYRNGWSPEAEPDDEMVSRFEECYRTIRQKAKEKYDNHLLFLHDYRVPIANNESKRLLRSYKRKQQQAVTFRSFETIEYLCQCTSELVQICQNEETRKHKIQSDSFRIQKVAV